MMIRNTLAHLVVVLALLIGFPRVIKAKPASQTKEASAAKVVRLLQDSGVTHRKTGANTWVIERPGKNPMLVASGAEFLVLGIIVAVKKNIRASGDLNFKLLKLNHSMDYVKCGFDDDDDLFVRTEVRIRLLDLPDFNAMVADVSAGAEKAYAVVKPFLITQ